MSGLTEKRGRPTMQVCGSGSPGRLHRCWNHTRTHRRRQRRAQGRRGRRAHSRAAGRTALPCPSRLHRPGRPRFSPHRGTGTLHTSRLIQNLPGPCPTRHRPGRGGGCDRKLPRGKRIALPRDSTEARDTHAQDEAGVAFQQVTPKAGFLGVQAPAGR